MNIPNLSNIASNIASKMDPADDVISADQLIDGLTKYTGLEPPRAAVETILHAICSQLNITNNPNLYNVMVEHIYQNLIPSYTDIILAQNKERIVSLLFGLADHVKEEELDESDHEVSVAPEQTLAPEPVSQITPDSQPKVAAAGAGDETNIIYNKTQSRYADAAGKWLKTIRGGDGDSTDSDKMPELIKEAIEATTVLIVDSIKDDTYMDKMRVSYKNGEDMMIYKYLVQKNFDRLTLAIQDKHNRKRNREIGLKHMAPIIEDSRRRVHDTANEFLVANLNSVKRVINDWTITDQSADTIKSKNDVIDNYLSTLFHLYYVEYNYQSSEADISFDFTEMIKGYVSGITDKHSVKQIADKIPLMTNVNNIKGKASTEDALNSFKNIFMSTPQGSSENSLLTSMKNWGARVKTFVSGKTKSSSVAPDTSASTPPAGGSKKNRRTKRHQREKLNKTRRVK